jgi:hypothetical protein
MPLTSILSPLAGRGGGALGNDFENVFFICSDQLSLGNSSRQRGNNVNVISDTANAHHFRAEITADCDKISMHSRPHV